MLVYRNERGFPLFNYLLFTVLGFVMLAPVIHLLALSLSGTYEVNAGLVSFWPRGFNVKVYQHIFAQTMLWRSLAVSVYITVVGTLIALALTATLAYALSRPDMPFKRTVLRGILVTFIFSVPLIPFYLLVKQLHMDNTLWALMVPGALGAFNVIIIKTFFQGISAELFDAAAMDGSSEYGMFARIAIPLSGPVIATISLFQAVNQWNSYFYALIFIRAKELMPIQVVLRSLVLENQAVDALSISEAVSVYTPEQMKAGIVLFATLPIIVVYPFLQKYFVKGAMVGSLKE